MLQVEAGSKNLERVPALQTALLLFPVILAELRPYQSCKSCKAGPKGLSMATRPTQSLSQHSVLLPILEGEKFHRSVLDSTAVREVPQVRPRQSPMTARNEPGLAEMLALIM